MVSSCLSCGGYGPVAVTVLRRLRSCGGYFSEMFFLCIFTFMDKDEIETLKADAGDVFQIFDSCSPFGNNGSFNGELVKSCIHKIASRLLDEKDCNSLFDWMENNEFFSSPASSRFHGNVKGGLAAHSLMVVRQCFSFAVPLFENFLLAHKEGNWHFSATDIFLAAIAHDFCKAGFYSTEYRQTKNFEGNWVYEPYFKVKSGNRNLGHGNESVLVFLSVFPRYINNRPVLEAISRHMGFSDLSENESFNYSVFLENPLVILLQLADQTASQWFNL